MKKNSAGQLHNIIFVCIFVLFTVFAVLDIFVIPKKYAVADQTPERTFRFVTLAPAETATAGTTLAAETDAPEETPVTGETAAPTDAPASAPVDTQLTTAPLTPEPTAESTSEPTLTPEPTAELTPTPESALTPEPTAVPTPTPKPTASPTPTSTLRPTPVPTPTPTPKPTLAPTPTPAPTPFPFTDGEVLTNDTSYIDANIGIVITTYRTHDTDVHVAEVYLRSAEYFRTAFAYDTFGKNVRRHTSRIALSCGALLAVNGDYYGARPTGYVLRNGVLYQNTSSGRDGLAVMYDGSMRIFTEGSITAEALQDEGAWQIFTFGPGLIVDGRVAVSADSEVAAHLESNPRTAIGMISPLHYIFAVSDGRTSANAGLTLLELAEFLKTLGVTQAYNLDGGGSSSMVFMGRIINQPTSRGVVIEERSVSDIVYIGYKKS